MHERLKFKIQLNENRGNDPTWGFQPIFTESKYGTHYVINARFEGKKIESDDTKFKLKNIHFYLQNYTGAVTVGLEKYSIIKKYKAHEKQFKDLLEPSQPDSNIYKIILFARGLNNNFHHLHEIKENMNIVKFGDIIDVDVIYLPISKLLSHYDNEDSFERALYVDPIYMERDGEDVNLTSKGKNLILRMNNIGLKELDDGKFDFESIENFEGIEGVGAGRPCKASVSMFI